MGVNKRLRVNGFSLVDYHGQRPLISKCGVAKILNALRTTKDRRVERLL